MEGSKGPGGEMGGQDSVDYRAAKGGKTNDLIAARNNRTDQIVVVEDAGAPSGLVPDKLPPISEVIPEGAAVAGGELVDNDGRKIIQAADGGLYAWDTEKKIWGPLIEPEAK